MICDRDSKWAIKDVHTVMVFEHCMVIYRLFVLSTSPFTYWLKRDTIVLKAGGKHERYESNKMRTNREKS